MAKREVPSASIALEVARVQLASLPRGPGLLALPCRASGGEEPETGLQERGQGGTGLEDEEAGKVVLSLSFQRESRVQIRIYHL